MFTRSSDLHQAVTITLDPPLQVADCPCWQLLRNHDKNKNNTASSSSTYTIEDSENLAFNEGFVLVAMNADGSKYFPSNHHDHHQDQDNVGFYFVAPNPFVMSDSSTTDDKKPQVLSKPLMKNAVILVPFYSSSANSPLFSWKATRFPGGGISFHTTMERTSRWISKYLSSSSTSNQPENQEPEEEDEDKDEHVAYYLTDGAKLLSEELCEGPVGYGMNLAYPPVVDVTCLLDHKSFQNSSFSSSRSNLIDWMTSAIEKTKKCLVDAAVDCGFFYAVIQSNSASSSSSSSSFGFEHVSKQQTHQEQDSVLFISSDDAHSSCQRLMQIIRNVFGRSISAKKRLMMNSNEDEKDSSNSTTVTPPPPPPHFSNCFPIDEQLTKVTLKSTTGEVKTSFNPPKFSKIELPEWMKNICDENSANDDDDDADKNQPPPLVEKCCRAYFENYFVPAHFTTSNDQKIITSGESEPKQEQSLSDLETHFYFGEELAARMIGILLRGVSTKITTQWPTPEMIHRHHRLYSNVEITNIKNCEIKINNSDADDASSSSEKSISIPRVDPQELYSLFRSVCYPPSTRKHDKKLKKLLAEQIMATTTNGENDECVDEEEIEYVYEEVEEEQEQKDDDEKSSHKSSNTDDSQGKALYEHTDKTWITLLTASPSLHGLEVVDIDGSTFTECCVPKFLIKDNFNNNTNNARQNTNHQEQGSKIFAFICNIGDALMLVSNGKYISRTHRARNPNLSATTINEKEDDQHLHHHSKWCCCQDCRISLPLFVEPSPFRWPPS